jgi:hypothetical protein
MKNIESIEIDAAIDYALNIGAKLYFENFDLPRCS